MSEKKVSILVSNFNYGRYLEECLDSILNQDYKNIEIILYDDGSTDNSKEILQKYLNQVTIIFAENYKKSTYINQLHAIYEAFKVSSGDIICLMDSDDFYYQNKVSMVVDIFEKFPKIKMVQHIFDSYDENSKKIDESIPLILQQNIKQYIEKTHNIFYLFSSTSGLCFEREFFEKAFPITENYENLSPDVKLYLTAAVKGEIHTIFAALGGYRIHGENNSTIMRSEHEFKKYLSQAYDFYNVIRRQCNLSEIPVLREIDILYGSPINQHIDFTKLNNIEETSEVYIWGAGESGKVMADYLIKRGIKVKGFIDRDPRKNCIILEDESIRVLKFSDIELNDSLKILIGSYFHQDEIEQFLWRNIGRNFVCKPFKR